MTYSINVFSYKESRDVFLWLWQQTSHWWGRKSRVKSAFRQINFDLTSCCKRKMCPLQLSQFCVFSPSFTHLFCQLYPKLHFVFFQLLWCLLYEVYFQVSFIHIILRPMYQAFPIGISGNKKWKVTYKWKFVLWLLNLRSLQKTNRSSGYMILEPEQMDAYIKMLITGMANR